MPLNSQELLEGIHNQLISLNGAVGEVSTLFADIKEGVDMIKDTGVRQFQFYSQLSIN